MTHRFSRNSFRPDPRFPRVFSVQAESAALRSLHKQKGAQSAHDRAGFDMTEMISLAAGLRADDMGAGTPMAIAPGTTVLTLDGALPVDHLYPGDRLVTRHGARPLAALDRFTLAAGTPIVEIAKNALGGRPERDLWLPAGQRIVIRDWRAKALYGQAQVCIAAGQLVDGEFVRLSELAEDVTVYTLRFGRPEVFYADGLELASADPLTVPA
jgi:hypothetical protein